MSTYRAQRGNGSCFGSLTKQHTSVTSPFSSYTSNFVDDSSTSASLSSLREALSGASLSSSSLTDTGATLAETEKDKNTVTAALDGNDRSKVHEFCVLVGVIFIGYDSYTAFRRGDHPTSEVRIVGASSWNPTSKKRGSAINSPTFRLVTYAGTHIYCTANSVEDRDIWLEALHAGLEVSLAGYHITTELENNNDNLYSTENDLKEFLDTNSNSNGGDTNTALTDGTSSSTIQNNDTTDFDTKLPALYSKILTPPKAQRNARTQVLRRQSELKRSKSKNFGSGHSTTLSPSSSFSSFVSSPSHASGSHKGSFSNPYEFPEDEVICDKHCISCGRFPPKSAMPTNPSTTLPQYGMENRVKVCQPCLVTQGVFRHVSILAAWYQHELHGRAAIINARKMVLETIEEASVSAVDNLLIPMDTAEYSNKECNNALLQLVCAKSPSIFVTYRRRSSELDSICCDMEEHMKSSKTGRDSAAAEAVAEFLEKLKEASSLLTLSLGDEADTSANDEFRLKKEALKVAGDMGTAIKLLHEHALCRGSQTYDDNSNRDMLACILDFLLDLCDDGQLSTLGFFWPQLCQIHLKMLPPTDTQSFLRVELMEDFLLTVCVKYSVHLALHLVWNCIADLEDGMIFENSNTISVSASSTSSFPISGSASRRRRFAVLRFVCELESLLFDFDGGWGGGSVSLRNMLIPSDHQAALIRDAMVVIQAHRRCSRNHLARSARIDKLRRDYMNLNAYKSSSEKKLSDKASADRKYHIARNAEYYSTQLMFTRRLGDIAESLFHMDVSQRASALQRNLASLNASGRMGGDPLNQVIPNSDVEEIEDGATGDKCSHGLINVLHIPNTEGHVFRSKERTPVLLLMEVVRDEGIMANVPRSSYNRQSSTEEEIEGHESDEKKEKDGDELISNLCLSEEKLIEMGIRNRSDSDEDEINHDSSLQDHVEQGQSRLNKAAEKLNSDSDEIKHSENSFITVDVRHANSLCQEELSLQMKSSPNDDLFEALCTPKTPMNKKTQVVGTPTRKIAKSPENIRDMQTLVTNIMQQNVHFGIPNLTPDSNKKGTNVTIDLPNDNDFSADNSVDANGKTQINSSRKDTKRIDYYNKKEQQEESVPNSQNQHGSFLKDDAEQLTFSASSTILQRKISVFGSHLKYGNCINGEKSMKFSLSANGEGRRQVLTAMFLKGMKSSNLIARGVAPVAQRVLQELDHKRAKKLILSASSSNEGDQDNLNKNNPLQFSKVDQADRAGKKITDDSRVLDNEDCFQVYSSDEDECIESVRLLLIQNLVAGGSLSPENAARTLASARQNSRENSGIRQEQPLYEKGKIDAGKIDERLIGCGNVSVAVQNALKLWKENIISNSELLELVKKDVNYTRLALPGATNEDKLMEDSAFWGRFAFGERWAEKKARLQASSPFGSHLGWDLTGVIVKANDDLRQEAFVMQLISLCEEAFKIADLELWIQPYCILATGRTTGVIEMVRDAMSFDSLKKRPGYSDGGGLLGHFRRMTEFAADPKDALKVAQTNFVRSLAPYSLLSYLFLFKDRHNGNILLDTAGHVIHIDFGFVFGVAPGGSFSLEQSVPFKLTDEMIKVMDGFGSDLFSEFVTLFCCGFLALQANAETFLTLVRIMSEGSTFKCFEGKDSNEIVTRLRERFCLDLDREGTVAHAMELIRQATNSFGTKQYDYFQFMSQGIA
eukprot:CAMPEP_0184866710 /NCGR_PEP_ID=MMETSP0580-20130426/23385_1 /TAXON_ID=1118495 /ORGANISM="Dactyliosolen fragilissimus" /LENGTH=1688 /DNA_ID=CAMNT_0027366529 /DNA_START=61 /DNA_END=5123 /DNA_ORIENTATION=+